MSDIKVKLLQPPAIRVKFPQQIVASQAARVLSIESDATPEVNVDHYDVLEITNLEEPITEITFLGTPTDKQKLLISFKDDGTPRTIIHGSDVVNSGTANALTTTVAGKTHLEGLIFNSAIEKWVCYASDPVGY